MSAAFGLCEFLEWDTQFFGARVARVCASILNPVRLLEINRWCEEEGIACLYFLASATDPQTPRLAERDGFQLVDVRVEYTLSGKPPIEIGNHPIRRVAAADLEPILSLVPANACDSRFYFDENFPRDAGVRLYRRWIQQSCASEVGAVFVSGEIGSPVGYITCEPSACGAGGRIGLLGVSDTARRAGVGAALVAGAVDWFSQHGITPVKVVTQARNVSAQRLYQRAGFLTSGVQLWYHKWFRQQKLP